MSLTPHQATISSTSLVSGPLRYAWNSVRGFSCDASDRRRSETASIIHVDPYWVGFGLLAVKTCKDMHALSETHVHTPGGSLGGTYQELHTEGLHLCRLRVPLHLHILGTESKLKRVKSESAGVFTCMKKLHTFFFRTFSAVACHSVLQCRLKYSSLMLGFRTKENRYKWPPGGQVTHQGR